MLYVPLGPLVDAGWFALFGTLRLLIDTVTYTYPYMSLDDLMLYVPESKMYNHVDNTKGRASTRH